MFPERVPVAGYHEFPKLEEMFKAEYVDGPPVIDIRGVRIHFHGPRPNGFRDFEHASIGREGMKGARPEPFDKDRAECSINFIRFVVSSPDVYIYASLDGPPDQIREIYQWQGREGDGMRVECYRVVITYYRTDPDKAWYFTSYPVPDLHRFNSIGINNKAVSTPNIRAIAKADASHQAAASADRVSADTIASLTEGMSRKERQRLRRQQK